MFAGIPLRGKIQNDSHVAHHNTDPILYTLTYTTYTLYSILYNIYHILLYIYILPYTPRKAFARRLSPLYGGLGGGRRPQRSVARTQDIGLGFRV